MRTLGEYRFAWCTKSGCWRVKASRQPVPPSCDCGGTMVWTGEKPPEQRYDRGHEDRVA